MAEQENSLKERASAEAEKMKTIEFDLANEILYCNASNRVPELYLIFGVTNGDSIRGGGVNRGKGLINFAPWGRFFLHFLSKCMLFMLISGEILPLLLIKHVNSHCS